MLADGRRSENVLLVHRVRQNDVDDLDVFHLAEPLEFLITEQSFPLDAILAAKHGQLVRRSRNQRGHAAFLRLPEGRQYLLDRETTQSDDGEADAFTRREGAVRILFARFT